jgi:ribosomal protein S18 acetylase RimI-like enzyme
VTRPIEERGSAPLAIRPARRADLDRLLAIEHNVFATDRLSRRSFREHLRRATQRLIVAARGNEVVGYALISFRKNSRSARLYSLAAQAEAGRGVGSALLQACEAEARARGCAALRLEVNERNARAVRLYERNGFIRAGRRENYYEDGAPALLYRKELAWKS